MIGWQFCFTIFVDYVIMQKRFARERVVLVNDKNKTPEVKKCYDVISQRIVSGQYPAGCRLVETQLAAELSASRTPVRLAIERLVSEGFAKHIPNRGAIVRHMTFEEIRDIFHIRMVNEGLLARLANKRVRSGDSDELGNILANMEAAIEAGDGDTYYTLSTKFHEYVMEMAQSPTLAAFVKQIYRITQRYHLVIVHLPGRNKESLKEHRAIAEAILTGTPDESEQHMVDHIRTIGWFFSNERNKIFLDSITK